MHRGGANADEGQVIEYSIIKQYIKVIQETLTSLDLSNQQVDDRVLESARTTYSN